VPLEFRIYQVWYQSSQYSVISWRPLLTTSADSATLTVYPTRTRLIQIQDRAAPHQHAPDTNLLGPSDTWGPEYNTLQCYGYFYRHCDWFYYCLQRFLYVFQCCRLSTT
jgi:hypothetical protein